MGGSSKSSSSSKSYQYWYDQRVAATDDAIVVGANSSGNRISRSHSYRLTTTDHGAVQEAIRATLHALDVNKATGATAMATVKDTAATAIQENADVSKSALDLSKTTIAGALETLEGARADNADLAGRAITMAENYTKDADERQFAKALPWVFGSVAVYAITKVLK